MKYQKLKDGYIRRMSDLALIPENEANTDYRAYLADAEKEVEVVNENAVISLTPEQLDQQEAEARAQAEKLSSLNAIDQKRIRLLSDIALGQGSVVKAIRGKQVTPLEELAALEAEAETIRTK
ncbi:MAG: hypothetical protein GX567_19400 [Clostridia bacterium]|nr:hypothetical protein [Clostridia bacterium]